MQAQNIQHGFSQRGSRLKTLTRSLITIIAFALFVPCGFGQSKRQTTGTVQGVVFSSNSHGNRSLISSANISLDGPIAMKAKSEGQGFFAFDAVPHGNYKITAHALGMIVTRDIAVAAETISEVNLELKLEDVKQSDTVIPIANSPIANSIEPNDPPASIRIGGFTLGNTSDTNMQFERSFPLFPDVASGSNGQSNPESVHKTQSGMPTANAGRSGQLSGNTLNQAITTTQAQLGQVNGTVVDLRGDPISSATVVLLRTDSPDRRTLTTNELGFFEFRSVEPGVSYQIIASATGFDDWKSPQLELNPGQVTTLGGISLNLAAVHSTTTVTYDPSSAAHEQLKAEEKQRVFGILPNFYVSYEGDNAAPMTAKMKFQLALKASYDPFTIGGAALWAGIRQATNTPNFRQGWEGYGERFGAVSADGFSHLMISDAILQSVLHEDPRYFYQGTGTTNSRLWHAVRSPFWSRRDNGTWGPNYSTLGGDLASCALMNLYYPESNRGAGLVFSQFAIGTAEHIVSSLAQEFVLSKFTHRNGHFNPNG